MSARLARTAEGWWAVTPAGLVRLGLPAATTAGLLADRAALNDAVKAAQDTAAAITVSLLLAAACLVPAAAKLLSHPRMRHAAAHFGIPWPRYQLIGAAELAAAGGVLIGLRWHPLGLAAAAGMALLLLGAVITHRRAADGPQEMAPALLALAITIAYLAVVLTS